MIDSSPFNLLSKLIRWYLVLTATGMLIILAMTAMLVADVLRASEQPTVPRAEPRVTPESSPAVSPSPLILPRMVDQPLFIRTADEMAVHVPAHDTSPTVTAGPLRPMPSYIEVNEHLAPPTFPMASIILPSHEWIGFAARSMMPPAPLPRKWTTDPMPVTAPAATADRHTSITVGLFVKVGFFISDVNLKRNVDLLVAAGLPVATRPLKTEAGSGTALFSGPYDDERMAARALAQIRALGFEDAWL